MGQRSRELIQIWGDYGWRVTSVFYEGPGGTRMHRVAGYDVPQEVRLVLHVEHRGSASSAPSRRASRSGWASVGARTRCARSCTRPRPACPAQQGSPQERRLTVGWTGARRDRCTRDPPLSRGVQPA